MLRCSSDGAAEISDLCKIACFVKKDNRGGKKQSYCFSILGLRVSLLGKVIDSFCSFMLRLCLKDWFQY